MLSLREEGTGLPNSWVEVLGAAEVVEAPGPVAELPQEQAPAPGRACQAARAAMVNRVNKRDQSTPDSSFLWPDRDGRPRPGTSNSGLGHRTRAASRKVEGRELHRLLHPLAEEVGATPSGQVWVQRHPPFSGHPHPHLRRHLLHNKQVWALTQL